MKTLRNIRRCIVAATLALAVIGTVSVSGTALAQEKGATKLLRLYSVKTVEDLQALDEGDTVVMSCPKCKDTWVTVVEKTLKGARPEELKSMQIHLCPSCETKLVTKGHGKQAQDVLIHTCKTCGSKDVFCCVMKKGSHPTQGMEQK